MKKTLTLLGLILACNVYGQNTVQTINITPGRESSNPSNLTVFKDRLYFYATDENYNQQIWSTDGVTAPTKTIIIGKTTGNHRQVINSGAGCMAVLNNKLYFVGRDSQDTFRIYYTDGTTKSSISLNTANTHPYLFTVFKNQLYFAHFSSSTTHEVYRLNPTDNSITRVTGISVPSGVGFSEMVELNGKLMISGYDGNNFHYKLWEYNPVNNTTIVVDSSFSGGWGSTPSTLAKLVVENNRLYYRFSDFFRQYTGIGKPSTIARMDYTVQDGDFMLNNGIIYYTGMASLTGNISLSWKNTLDDKNRQLSDINGSNIDGIVKFGKYLSSNVFITQGTYTYNNTNIWLLNGTNAPTNLSNTIDLTVSPAELVEFKGSLYFRTFDTTNGDELSKYTNTSLGTTTINNAVLSAYAYPNPANEYTTISFDVKSTQQLSIQVTDMQGRVVYQTPAATYTAQKHTVQVPMQSLPSGIYNFAINNGDAVLMASGKIVKE